MNKLGFSIFVLFILLSCSKNKKVTEKQELEITHENKNVLKDNPKFHDNDDPNRKSTITPDFNSIFPKNEAELDEWKRKVCEEGDTLYFEKLSLCNMYNEGLRKEGYKGYDISNDQMRVFADAMISKHTYNQHKSTNYKYQYMIYPEFSESVKKEDIEKAMKYANDILKSVKDVKLITMQAREFISKVYKEGIYVNKDIVIADYFDKGGRNLDSIVQVRQLKK